ncbi:hypothetical protein FJR48_07250 [Sulfurimonas lithotrophica]|uniref:YlxR domain-containing protein n=1 Tax=Sulfurimonas lithotrophica TaxID=2590022 RepID=A0A5P8P4C0_9BACT|nr:hypothetical protein FJR48_07250 [Sulfurimonas lithotrophica]
MCISCRERDFQQNMLRLRCIDGNIEIFNGSGRTFYLCNDCLKDEKKLLRSLMRQCKSGDKEKLMNKLKEIITDDR